MEQDQEEKVQEQAGAEVLANKTNKRGKLKCKTKLYNHKT